MKRLNKVLEEAGLCSRREADRLIAAGQVTVDGDQAVLGMQVDAHQEICVSGQPIPEPQKPVVLAMNKPKGYVCTEDPREPKRVGQLLPEGLARVTYAGRLDKDSEGLLLLTNDGDLINRMMRSRYAHEKEYTVTLDQPVTEEFLRQLRQGMVLWNADKKTQEVARPCQAWKTGASTFSIILTQGLHRQIRRMCDSLGGTVQKLVRVRVVNVKLGTLKPGEVRTLSKEEIQELYERTAETETHGGVGYPSQSGF